VAFTQDVYMYAIPRMEKAAAQQIADLISERTTSQSRSRSAERSYAYHRKVSEDAALRRPTWGQLLCLASLNMDANRRHDMNRPRRMSPAW
jgi:hypothetical protein